MVGTAAPTSAWCEVHCPCCTMSSAAASLYPLRAYALIGTGWRVCLVHACLPAGLPASRQPIRLYTLVFFLTNIHYTFTLSKVHLDFSRCVSQGEEEV